MPVGKEVCVSVGVCERERNLPLCYLSGTVLGAVGQDLTDSITTDCDSNSRSWLS